MQHRIPEYAGQLWDFVTRGGYIYVCGQVQATCIRGFLMMPLADRASVINLQLVDVDAEGGQKGAARRVQIGGQALGRRCG